MQDYLNYPSLCLSKGTIPSHVEIDLPASKSISNRLLILKDLSTKNVEISNLSRANDTQLLNRILDSKPNEIDVEDAGTTARFSLAWACIQNKQRKIVGSSRLYERPMAELINALRYLGFNVICDQKEGFFPVTVLPVNFSEIGNEVEIEASRSSQFVSALCLIAPFLPSGLNLGLLGIQSSRPYISMTTSLLKTLGVEVVESLSEIRISPKTDLMGRFKVESDWSSAAFWYEISSLVPNSKILLKGLEETSIQGDRALVDLYTKLGVKSTFVNEGVELSSHQHNVCIGEIDFNDFPDLAQPLIWGCALYKIPLSVKGVHTLANKETDRIVALQNELKKIDARLVQNGDEFSLSCGISSLSAKIDFKTYNDHRMAMALSASVFKTDEVIIENPQVVKKSFPMFWVELNKMGVEIRV